MSYFNYDEHNRTYKIYTDATFMQPETVETVKPLIQNDYIGRMAKIMFLLKPAYLCLTE